MKNLHFRKGRVVQCVLFEIILCFRFLLPETYRKESLRKNGNRKRKTIQCTVSLRKDVNKDVLPRIVESSLLRVG
jgi:hypothetical protein